MILTIFDFDETICANDGAVRIVDKSKDIEFYLTATEYSDWREKDLYDANKHEMDFSEFIGYPKNGKPISPVCHWFIDYCFRPEVQVAVATGRDELSGPKEWMKDNNLPTTGVAFACSGDPNKTYMYEGLVNTYEPSEIVIFEDAPAYIELCKKVAKKYNIPIKAWLMKLGRLELYCDIKSWEE